MDPVSSSFEALLREKLEELDADERSLEDDPVGQFSAEAHRLLLMEHGGPLPRAGHGAYTRPLEEQRPAAPHRLDIKS